MKIFATGFVFFMTATLTIASDLPLPKKYVYPSIESLRFKVMDLKDDESFALMNPAILWQPLMTEVRSGMLPREEAVVRMKDLIDEFNTFIESSNFPEYPNSEWVFPVRGYDASSIGGVNGSGYRPGGFDFFVPGSGIHPAHDIFIRDRNQDCLDDLTGMPVEILSMSGGLVVEKRDNWTPDMDTRGGNFVYVFDNFSQGLFYYAHLNDVYVNVGDFVVPGFVLGTMGRTGTNALPARSPTHLHIMYVKSYDGDIRCEDIYRDLLNAKIIR